MKYVLTALVFIYIRRRVALSVHTTRESRRQMEYHSDIDIVHIRVVCSVREKEKKHEHE